MMNALTIDSGDCYQGIGNTSEENDGAVRKHPKVDGKYTLEGLDGEWFVRVNLT